MTKKSITHRQQRILEHLDQKESLSIQEIQELLDISQPTAYRDIQQLVEAGLVARTKGGITHFEPQTQAQEHGICAHCQAPISTRTAFLIQLEDEGHIDACCPHCGLIALGHYSDAQSGLATDFLYGSKINVLQAIYLAGSQVTLCCLPSVLCFGDPADARRFQLGFGGEVLSFAEARKYVDQAMSLTKTRLYRLTKFEFRVK